MVVAIVAAIGVAVFFAAVRLPRSRAAGTEARSPAVQAALLGVAIGGGLGLLVALFDVGMRGAWAPEPYPESAALLRLIVLPLTGSALVALPAYLVLAWRDRTR